MNNYKNTETNEKNRKSEQRSLKNEQISRRYKEEILELKNTLIKIEKLNCTSSRAEWNAQKIISKPEDRIIEITQPETQIKNRLLV